MSAIVLVRPVHFPPGREDVGLEWLRVAMQARCDAGMTYHAILRSRVDPHDYAAMMIWPDQTTYDRWHVSEERGHFFADQPHYLVREPTSRSLLIEP
ncbi:MAG: hypothetical protein EPO26_01380 [Chloroflexota bacterium]|nr:MAG: hypothetical protein EPO26_01380 [Chloroflexota bacterium]